MIIKTLLRLAAGGVKRAVTKEGGSFVTLTNEQNKWDSEAYIALIIRGLIILGFALAITKLGLSPDILDLIVEP